MTDKLEERLKILRKEYQRGEQQLADLEQEADQLRSSLLRIAGAIQVLEELMDEGGEN